MRTPSFGRVTVAATLGVMLMIAAVAPAAARQESRDRYSWSDAGTYACGAGNPIDWTAGGTGLLTIREGTGRQTGMVFAHDTYQWHATDTRLSDGASVHFVGHGTTREIQARHVAGTVYELTSVDSGNLVVTDDAGTVLSRNAGSVREVFRIDTATDEITSVSVRINGPHSGIDTCSVLGD